MRQSCVRIARHNFVKDTDSLANQQTFIYVFSISNSFQTADRSIKAAFPKIDFQKENRLAETWKGMSVFK